MASNSILNYTLVFLITNDAKTTFSLNYKNYITKC